MSKEEQAPQSDLAFNVELEDLTVEDVSRYLNRLAALNDEPRTGNKKLSTALRSLAGAMRTHQSRSITEFVELLKEAKPKSERPRSGKIPHAALPTDLEALPQKEVEKILQDERYPKAQLTELGSKRFGISRSKLTRQSKQEVIQSIRAALDHERSLGVISQEARRGGEKRS
ncbi:MAG: hypothetical protein GKR94_17575 [Gammaproteobacteria bacterium]|nr:hypothetical protein [Gammaproteobacteria bacterium]